MILPILKDDHPSLLTKCEEVTMNDDLKFIDYMIQTLAHSGGIGLAANQVGILKRVILVKNGSKFNCYVNPKIVKTSKEVVTFKEGCLSYPNHYIEKTRFKKVFLQFQCLKTKKPKKLKFSGVQSIIIQHELDHLNGISWINSSSKEKAI